MAEEKRPITVDDLYRINYVEEPRISPDGQWIAYVHMTVNRVQDGYKRNIWLVPTKGGDPVQVTQGDKDSSPRWSPDGTMLAFVSGRKKKPQIYVLPVAGPGGEARPLTDMPYGAHSPAWSPDSQQIAFLAPRNGDERAREDRNEEDTSPLDKFEAEEREKRKEHEETQRWDPRPMWRIQYRTGKEYLDDRFDQLYVIAVNETDDTKPRRLTDSDANHTQPQWMPDGGSILTTRAVDPELDEHYMWQCLYRVSVKEGAVEQLTDRDYLSYRPLPSPDGQWIAYERLPRDAFWAERISRLTILPATGGDGRELTVTFDRAPQEFRWLPDSSGLIFSAGSEGNTEPYQITLESGDIEKLTDGVMMIDGLDVGPDGGIAFSISTPQNPSELWWYAAGAGGAVQMTTVNEQFLSEVIVQETSDLRFTSTDGEIQGWYILPVGYEAGKQYPLAFNIHGGPVGMWGPGARMMWHEWQFHAASGYVVFYCNPRGSSGYGEAFQIALHNAWGTVAQDDLMAGIDALVAQGFVDSERMALTGGSYGGYMTAWIVGHDHRFACGVSQRGVYDLLASIGTDDIPSGLPVIFDAEPWEDPMHLWRQSPIAYAQNIRTPLLLIHSENDFRCPIGEAEALFAYVRRSTNTPIKMLRYPREGHDLSRSGEPKHRVSRLTEMVKWFDQYCKEE